MTNAQLVPVILVPLLLWRLFRRIRRSVGRQNFRPIRMTVSIVLISLLLGTLGVFATQKGIGLLWPLLGGIVFGAGCASLGYKLTTFETTSAGRYYTPNAYLGVAISLILVARLVSRLSLLYVGPAENYSPATILNPLSLAVLGLTFGYFWAYSIFVLVRFGYRPQRTIDV